MRFNRNPLWCSTKLIDVQADECHQLCRTGHLSCRRRRDVARQAQAAQDWSGIEGCAYCPWSMHQPPYCICSTWIDSSFAGYVLPCMNTVVVNDYHVQWRCPFCVTTNHKAGWQLQARSKGSLPSQFLSFWESRGGEKHLSWTGKELSQGTPDHNTELPWVYSKLCQRKELLYFPRLAVACCSPAPRRLHAAQELQALHGRAQQLDSWEPWFAALCGLPCWQTGFAVVQIRVCKCMYLLT